MNAVSWRLMTLVGRLTRRLHVIAPQTVCVNDPFLGTDLILDLGGGGEGVIGQLRGRQVVAVDLSRDELRDAPPGPIKVVADARNLPFPDGSFEAATAFFFLMYVTAAERAIVVREAFRVLAPGGRLYIWDVTIPAPTAHAARTYLVPVRALLPARAVHTAYGIVWQGHELSPETLASLAADAGFGLVAATSSGLAFHLVFSKPD